MKDRTRNARRSPALTRTAAILAHVVACKRCRPHCFVLGAGKPCGELAKILGIDVRSWRQALKNQKGAKP